MTFQLDTTGGVGPMPGWHKPVPTSNRFIFWSDLSPFMQGYTTAAFQDVQVDAFGATFAERPMLRPAFHMLAPETLERIIADCSLACREGGAHMEGVDYGNRRQAGDYLTTRPPQTLQLCDDGKVRFA